MMNRAKAFLDKYVEKFVSRKFLAWLTATGLVFQGSVTSDNWVAITLAYIGIQGLADIAVQWKHGEVK
jgi:hypothetical protein